MIVGRLKNHMNKLTSSFQTGFVPGRAIHENIIIVNEAIHIMEKLKGKKGYFVIKVNM